MNERAAGGLVTERLYASFLEKEHLFIVCFSVPSDIIDHGPMERLCPEESGLLWFLEEWGKQAVCFVFCFFRLGMSLLSACPPLRPHPLMGHILGFHLFWCFIYHFITLFPLCHLRYLCAFFNLFLFKQMKTLSETNNKNKHCFYPLNLL